MDMSPQSICPGAGDPFAMIDWVFCAIFFVLGAASVGLFRKFGPCPWILLLANAVLLVVISFILLARDPYSFAFATPLTFLAGQLAARPRRGAEPLPELFGPRV
jgi:hypothetical protein